LNEKQVLWIEHSLFMIIKESVLYSGDNSGAKYVKCIHVLNKKNAIGVVGNTLLIVVKKFIHKKKLKRKLIYFGLLVTVRQYNSRLDGSMVKFCSNRVLLFSKQFKFLGTRIYGGISKDIRLQLNLGIIDKKKYQKIVSHINLAV
jgi:large subunit ribosomal protein L14